MAKVTINNVVKAFGDNVVIRDFTQTFDDGDFITLLGPSGCGKTTMLRMIAGFERPTSGEIGIGDRIVSSEKVFIPPEKRDIGMVFQSYAVWPHMTVFENVAYPLTIKRMSKADIKKAVDHVLVMVHLSQYAERIPSMLSGGQQQRVALARALVANPQLLLLDEPLSNLDAKLRESMRFEIKEIQQKYGITVVYVTHDQTEAMAMSDDIVLINRGVVQQVDSPDKIYNEPANQFVADFLGKVNFVKGYSESNTVKIKGTDQIINYPSPIKGDVELAIRPENIEINKADVQGDLKGTVASLFYLGDILDINVKVGEITIRVIASPDLYGVIQRGDEVSIKLKKLHVFNDTGSLEEQLKIMT